MQNTNLQSGFTIIELLATLTVAALLVAIAIPSFRDLITTTRLVTTTNNLIASFAYARSEAVRRTQTVRVDAISGSWGNGWVVLDQGGNNIRTFEAPADNIAINTATNSYSFDGRGLLENLQAAATISLCDGSGKVKTGRQIEISITGRPKLNREYICPPP